MQGILLPEITGQIREHQSSQNTKGTQTAANKFLNALTSSGATTRSSTGSGKVKSAAAKITWQQSLANSMGGGTGTVRQVTNGQMYLNHKLVTVTSLKERILCQASERIKTTWEDVRVGVKDGFTTAKNTVLDFIRNIDWKRIGIGAAKIAGAVIVLAVSAAAVVCSAGSIIPALGAIAGGSAGAASFFTLGTFAMGSAGMFMGASDLLEGGQDVAYGVINKTGAASWNVLRDSLFADNPDAYYVLEAGVTYGAGTGTYVMQSFLLGEQVRLEANMLKGSSNSTEYSLLGSVAEGRGGAYENALKNGSGSGLTEEEIYGVARVDIDANKNLIGDNLKPRTLSNVEARKWYLEQEAKIPDLIDKSISLEQQAKQAFDLRNQFRTQARELMSDRELAESLNITDPNRSWEQIVQRQIEKGFTGDDIYKEIIESAQRSRIEVNKSLGLE